MKNPGRDRASMTLAHIPGTSLDRLLEVVRELTALMQQENDFLRGGMPAALSALTDRKEQLTLCLQELTRGSIGLTGTEEEAVAVKRHLAASGTALNTLTRENMQLLEGAMSASRRRIESVMQAIRAHEGLSNGHGKGVTDFRISTVKFEV